MKHPFNARAPAFDADAINATIQRALASAGLGTTAGPMREVTDTIRRALGGSNHGLPGHGLDGESVIDVVARVIPAVDEPVASRHTRSATMPASGLTRSMCRVHNLKDRGR